MKIRLKSDSYYNQANRYWSIVEYLSSRQGRHWKVSGDRHVFRLSSQGHRLYSLIEKLKLLAEEKRNGAFNRIG